MTILRPLDPLSRQDAGYLRRERDEQPMHFSVSALANPATDGAALTVEQARDQIRGRVHRVPQLRHKIRKAPFDLGPTVWVDDEHFDVGRHVVDWVGAPTCEEETPAALAAVASRRLPRDRPLWQMLVGPAWPDGRVPVVWSVHHALMDGGLFTSVLRDLFGAQGDAGTRPWQPGRAPSAGRLLATGVSARVRARVRPRSSGPPQLGAPAVASAPALLVGSVSRERKVARLAMPLAQLRDARARTGATINDLYLVAVTAGLRRLLQARGELDRTQQVQALVPRDVRAAGEARVTGNRTWSMLIALPVGLGSVGEALTVVQRSTTAAKAAQRSAGAADFRFDIAASNVAFGGPHAVAAHELAGFSATAPLQGENRLCVIGSSHTSEFSVTFTADGTAFPDLDTLAGGTAEGFRAVCELGASA